MPSESEDSSRCVCAPGYYGSHCQGKNIICDTLLRISRNYVFTIFTFNVVKIIQCESSNVRVTTTVSTVDHVKWMRLMDRCSVETVTPDLQDHSVTVSLIFLLFKTKTKTTRMHSSRMRTVCCSGRRGGRVSDQGVSAWGGVSAQGCAPTPLWTE